MPSDTNSSPLPPSRSGFRWQPVQKHVIAIGLLLWVFPVGATLQLVWKYSRPLQFCHVEAQPSLRFLYGHTVYSRCSLVTFHRSACILRVVAVYFVHEHAHLPFHSSLLAVSACCSRIGAALGHPHRLPYQGMGTIPLLTTFEPLRANAKPGIHTFRADIQPHINKYQSGASMEAERKLLHKRFINNILRAFRQN